MIILQSLRILSVSFNFFAVLILSCDFCPVFKLLSKHSLQTQRVCSEVILLVSSWYFLHNYMYFLWMCNMLLPMLVFLRCQNINGKMGSCSEKMQLKTAELSSCHRMVGNSGQPAADCALLCHYVPEGLTRLCLKSRFSDRWGSHRVVQQFIVQRLLRQTLCTTTACIGQGAALM